MVASQKDMHRTTTTCHIMSLIRRQSRETRQRSARHQSPTSSNSSIGIYSSILSGSEEDNVRHGGSGDEKAAVAGGSISKPEEQAVFEKTSDYSSSFEDFSSWDTYWRQMDKKPPYRSRENLETFTLELKTQHGANIETRYYVEEPMERDPHCVSSDRAQSKVLIAPGVFHGTVVTDWTGLRTLANDEVILTLALDFPEKKPLSSVQRAHLSAFMPLYYHFFLFGYRHENCGADYKKVCPADCTHASHQMMTKELPIFRIRLNEMKNDLLFSNHPCIVSSPLQSVSYNSSVDGVVVPVVREKKPKSKIPQLKFKSSEADTKNPATNLGVTCKLPIQPGGSKMGKAAGSGDKGEDEKTINAKAGHRTSAKAGNAANTNVPVKKETAFGDKGEDEKAISAKAGHRTEASSKAGDTKVPVTENTPYIVKVIDEPAAGVNFTKGKDEDAGVSGDRTEDVIATSTKAVIRFLEMKRKNAANGPAIAEKRPLSASVLELPSSSSDTAQNPKMQKRQCLDLDDSVEIVFDVPNAAATKTTSMPLVLPPSVPSTHRAEPILDTRLTDLENSMKGTGRFTYGNLYVMQLQEKLFHYFMYVPTHLRNVQRSVVNKTDHLELDFKILGKLFFHRIKGSNYSDLYHKFAKAKKYNQWLPFSESQPKIFILLPEIKPEIHDKVQAILFDEIDIADKTAKNGPFK